jgi:hypothetical protein
MYKTVQSKLKIQIKLLSVQKEQNFDTEYIVTQRFLRVCEKIESMSHSYSIMKVIFYDSKL